MKSENLILRALEPADVDLLYEWENNTDIWHLSNTNTPFSRFDLEQYILNSDKDIYKARQVRFMIDLTDESNPATIGAIDLFDFDPGNKRAGVGILISEEYRSRGLASEALDLLISYVENVLKLHQLYCNINENNEISIRLFKSKGFQVIGLKKDWNLIKDQWVHEYMLQRLK